MNDILKKASINAMNMNSRWTECKRDDVNALGNINTNIGHAMDVGNVKPTIRCDIYV